MPADTSKPETTPRTVLIVPARVFGKTAALALALRGQSTVVARDLLPVPPQPPLDGIAMVAENEADLRVGTHKHSDLQFTPQPIRRRIDGLP